jgi:hypothetical protein
VKGHINFDFAFVSSSASSNSPAAFRHGFASKTTRIPLYRSVSSKTKHVTLKNIIDDAIKSVHHSVKSRERLKFDCYMVNSPQSLYRSVLFGAVSAAARAALALNGTKNFPRKAFIMPKGCIINCMNVIFRGKL